MGVCAISLGVCTIMIGVFTSRTLAEKYQIYHLKNQIADILLRRTYWVLKIWTKFIAVFLKGLFYASGRSSSLTVVLIIAGEDHCKEYEDVFSLHADLGRDFFRWTVANNAKPCTFHDHSNITNNVEGTGETCPYSDIHFVASQSTTPSGATVRASKKHNPTAAWRRKEKYSSNSPQQHSSFTTVCDGVGGLAPVFYRPRVRRRALQDWK